MLHREVLELNDSELAAILREIHRMTVTQHALYLIRIDALNVIVVQKRETLLALFLRHIGTLGSIWVHEEFPSDEAH